MTFNRIIWGLGWPAAPQGDVEYPRDRGPTHPAYLTGMAIDRDRLAALPTLFMAEGQNLQDVARVGSVQILGEGPSTIALRYNYDLSVPPITQDRLIEVATELGLSTYGRQFDWTRTHWTVQDGDLYRAMFRLAIGTQNTPRVFNLSSPRRIDLQQVSAMMPFDAGFTPTYQAIEAAAAAVGMRCSRADNIWEDHSVIQDIVSLIDRSKVVVCDVSGRNPNVFYETGIAHTLGRNVIVITRQPEDVPFDLRPYRYIHYHNNSQGLTELTDQLAGRMRTLLAQQ